MMMKRAQAAIVGMMLVIAGCGGAPATPVSTAAVAPSSTPTAGVSAPPVAAATATPAAATVQPAANSTPQPSAAATAKPTAAAATPAVKEAATAKPAVKETAAAPAATSAPASATPSPSAKPADGGTSTAAQAQVLYKDNCMACHGAGLAGDFGPNLTKVGSRKTKDEIVTQILGGKGDMPPFKSALKSEEIEVLAAWLADKK
ncbi:cytochrome c [Paenibacillus frigoriresistens]|uniref:c-type cytochrome n=1 Tax=Paenibacillus alginolyticus TaxID=59839 RepID=UPI0015658162|nr:cytochrome c [Paenibacillus frigoriresistens]NRF90462.1 cytochrome c [Paenibacillus frigoriresistens]